ncbi:MAG: hypothetical protein LUG93_02780 [Lachnospiraceae bacterium]|nr:hypothetical protein [Lachnospiraceae bacterium]
MDAFDQILQNADAASDAINSDQENWMSCDYLPVVAEEAFRAILDGDDEIYKLKAGRSICQREEVCGCDGEGDLSLEER